MTIRMCVLALLSFLALNFFFSRTTSAVQVSELDERLFPFSRIVQLQYGLDGRLVPTSHGVRSVVPPFEHYSMLNDVDVRSELELSPEQSKKLENILEQAKKNQERFGKEYRNPVGREAIVEKYLAERQEANEEMKDVLLPHQFKRLEQLEERKLLRSVGFRKYCESNAEKLGLDLTAGELAKMDSNVKDAAEQLLTEIADKKNEFVRGFLDSLPKQLQSEYERDKRFQIDLPLDLLILHADHFVAIEKDGKESRRNSDPSTDAEKIEHLIRTNVSFRLTDSGSLQRIESKSRLTTALSFWLKGVLELPNLHLETVGFQEDEAKGLLTALEDRGREVNDKFNERFESEGETDALLRDLRTWNDELDDYARQTLFQEILLPHQHRAFRELLEELEVRKVGIFALITGKRLESLSDDEKEKVTAYLSKATKKLKDSAIELEQDFIDSHLNLLSDSNREKVDESLGEAPDFLPPSMIVFRSVYPTDRSKK